MPEGHRLQDEAVYVDDPKPGKRLRKRGAAVGDHLLPRLAFQLGHLLGQVAVRDPRIRPLFTLDRPGAHDLGDVVYRCGVGIVVGGQNSAISS